MYEAKTQLSILYIFYVGNLSTRILARDTHQTKRREQKPMFLFCAENSLNVQGERWRSLSAKELEMPEVFCAQPQCCRCTAIDLSGNHRGEQRMELLTLQNFAGCVGQAFDLSLGESTVPLTLAEASPGTTQILPGMRRAPFSLVFRSSSAIVLPQQIYRLRNASLGALEIFLVPVARDKQGIVYQAVFN
ncbi:MULTISPECIES: hypothetical protein [Ensifer]|uniref:DUF6916 family protein n=1 Tax=Ensifer TaxID=106591 RepID=UPI001F1C802E|nr:MULTISPECIES: hypothetical protein [Ensifer]